ncbi:15567_t:CDS:2, partial [Cetraspora pellucida]
SNITKTTKEVEKFQLVYISEEEYLNKELFKQTIVYINILELGLFQYFVYSHKSIDEKYDEENEQIYRIALKLFICRIVSLDIKQKTGQKSVQKKTKLNGVYVFELQLEQINTIRNQQSATKKCKSFDNLGNSMQLKRNKQFGNQLLDLFEQQ